MKKRCFSMILLAVVLGACATDHDPRYQRDGEQYGVTQGVFRGRWWSYYERGCSYLAGQYYEEAIADFEKALEGRGADSWRARTYGLHFVEYFPNRELGVACFQAGRLGEAEAHLTTSLKQMDTERAHLFLDRVKKQQIAAGDLTDADKPSVVVAIAPAERLTTAPVRDVAVTALAPPEPVAPEKKKPAPKPQAPAKPSIIATPEIKVEINAQDDTGVSEVAVNGAALHQRGSAEALDMQEEIVLEEGTHTVEIAARDLAEKEAVEKVEVTVDLTGPTIGVFSPIEPTVTEYGTIILEGATVDKNGVIAVTVGERILAESEGKPRLDFNSELPLGDGENAFVLAATDVAGNETRSAIKVFKGDPDSVEAKLWLLEQKYPEGIRLAHNGPLTAALLDSLLAQAPENTGEIRLKSPAPDRPYRHSRTLRVSGEVVGKDRITALTINGEPFADLTGAPKESFNRRIPLKAEALESGAATVAVAIHAEDASGQVLDKALEVDVRPVSLDTRESRMPVAVLAFAGQGVETAASEMLRVTTESQLVNQGRFRVLDRMRLQEVLTEQQLAGALADPAEAISLGKLTPAHIFLVADVFKHDQAGLELKARAISTESSDVLATLDVFIENGNDTEAVKQACDKLAAQLTQTFPRLSGEVLGVRGKGDSEEMLLNWTQEDGVQEGAWVLVVHEEEPWVDEDTGEILEPGEYIEVGRAKVLSVSTSSTRARTLERKEEEISLEKGMPAITM